MARRRASQPPPLFVLVCAAAVACGDQTASPAIGFTYNWGDGPLEAFVQSELDRTRPPDGDSIRLIASAIGGWATFGNTPLAAEVRRATILSENRDVLAVVGPGGSREALQVAPIYAAAGVPHLVPTATSRLLKDSPSAMLLLAADDSVQGDFIAAFADSVLGARRLAIFYVPDEYGIGLATGTEHGARRRGATVLAREPVRLTQDCVEGARRAGEAFYDGAIAAVAARGEPDAVVFAVRTVEVACLARAARARWSRAKFLAGDGVYLDPLIFERAPTQAEGLYFVAFWHKDLPGAASQEFVERFTRVVGREPRHGEAIYFDATMIAAAAIRDGNHSRESVAEYVGSLGARRPPYSGVTGSIGFAPGSPRPLHMTQIVGRSTVLVRTP